MKTIELAVGMKITVRYMARGLIVRRDVGDPLVVPIVVDDPLWSSQDIIATLASFTGIVVRVTRDYIVLHLGATRFVAILHGTVRGVDVHENAAIISPFDSKV